MGVMVPSVKSTSAEGHAFQVGVVVDGSDQLQVAGVEVEHEQL
jgi:hypothetical protein